MKDLIEALQIFLKYGNLPYPTHCEHDILIVYGIEPQDVSPEDTERLDKLGFRVNEDYPEAFSSFRFGS